MLSTQFCLTFIPSFFSIILLKQLNGNTLYGTQRGLKRAVKKKRKSSHSRYMSGLLCVKLAKMIEGKRVYIHNETTHSFYVIF
ncbi:hypothetical protein FQN60_009909 [Etheostoma spectabile]|uniref:Secreted protein n=1 Tax=Etheostoma spectabile TaxID=54343 RepID=A0A5J5D598_9PERO|nr:hypothetical protein FQN60_009909 [Etheostoma spectabile]